jgi:hypothetical protein
MARATPGEGRRKGQRWSRQVSMTSDALDLVNRAGPKLEEPARARLERANEELRALFGRTGAARRVSARFRGAEPTRPR